MNDSLDPIMSREKKWTAKDIPDQTGKIVIVTGANSGVGFEAARALAQRSATVVLACCSLDKGSAAAEQIRSEAAPRQVNLLQLDLADLSSVRQFAGSFLGGYDRLDVLINNAGALPLLYAATSPDIHGGEYIGPDAFFGQHGHPHLANSSRRSRDVPTAQRLWEASEVLTGILWT